MTQLMQAANQWASRPDDERFCSLDDMASMLGRQRAMSRQTVVSSRKLEVLSPDGKDLSITGPSGIPYRPTHWAFGQLAGLAGASGATSYLRSLPAPLAADCLTYGLRYERDVKDTGVLITAGGSVGPGEFRAATGPNYGRIWNVDIVESLRKRFGDGISGDWKVPGEFGVALDVVTKSNTTLFASDRDMFVFLADEDNRIELPNRRAGRSGSLARGFFVWNSEVGSRSFGIATFLFDYTCCNRIVWGAEEYREITFRHTASAPDKFLEQVKPQLLALKNVGTRGIVDGLKAAQAARIDDLDEWLAKRKVGPDFAQRMSLAHRAEEERPIETVWDAVTAATAVAREMPHQDARVDVERKAGSWLDQTSRASVSPQDMGL